jgi:cytochrome oxidase assembly protein ShyY1
VYRFVFSWRWIRLHVLIWLILIPAFIGLGMWQQSRYHERSAENRVLSAAIHGTPVPLDSLDAVGATVPRSERWKQVSASGTYDTAHQYLARNHQQDGNPGFWVITPLIADDGTAVLVNRGWIATSDNVQASPPIPAPPAGRVSVTARLETTETKNSTGIRDITAGLPAGQISLINTIALTEGTGLKLRGGYVELISSQPADAAGITLLGEPSLDSGPYLAYWFQWWLFAAMAVGAWWMIIRREAQHRAEDAAETESEGAGDGSADAETIGVSEPVL